MGAGGRGFFQERLEGIVAAYQWLLDNIEKPEDLHAFEAAQERGARTPLDDMPEQDGECRWYLNAFNQLARPIGLAAGPIPLQEIVTYWREVSRIGPLDEFLAVIKALDRAFLASQRPAGE